MEAQDLPLFLTVYEAAELLRLKRSTAYELVRQGVIPSCRLGRFIRIPRNVILEMANGRKQENQTGGAKP